MDRSKIIRLTGMALGLGLGAVPALAQNLFVYPAQGQSAEQQAADERECRGWSVQQSGFDPANPPLAPLVSAPPPQQGSSQPGIVGTGARGAAVGALGGAIAGDVGRGAAIGATSGALIGGMRRHDQNQAQRQSEADWHAQQRQIQQQHQAQVQQGRSNFERAFRTCMQARGYTVG